ncbi:hypothetical protein A2V82_16110 [candidate division KSB1 bacterium RBG_16_48_16]|nr:MAG: hypothetical protein A2V82_16110 [candidate division KSB1 bacterium RBG_16_48_16]
MYKNFFYLLFPLIVCFAACESRPANEMEDHYKATAVKVFKIFDSGNVDELDALIASDVADNQLDPSVTTKTGLEGVKDMFRYYHRIFPDMKTTIHSIAVAGDTVFVHATSVGTGSEPFMGMPANQKQTISSVDILRFSGDKIVEHRGFIDFADMMKMMPPPMPSGTSMMKNMNR